MSKKMGGAYRGGSYLWFHEISKKIVLIQEDPGVFNSDTIFLKTGFMGLLYYY